MPIITVESWPMDNERKANIIKKITEVFTEMDIPAQAITVIIHETQQDNWGTGGEQHSIKFKDIIKDMAK